VSVMELEPKKIILRIELWHGVLLALLVGIFSFAQWGDTLSLLAGGIFIGVNFWLLSYGVALVLTPLGRNGRVKVGIGLLVLKTVIFLGLLTALFSRFTLDAVSFSLGVTVLIVAILVEGVRSGMALRT
jgi:hypothetical protein